MNKEENNIDREEPLSDELNAVISQLDALEDLLVKKNKDYGNSAFINPILTPNIDAQEALFVRLSDKIKRLAIIRANKKVEVQDETISDTLRDLAGYSILILASMELKNENFITGLKNILS